MWILMLAYAIAQVFGCCYLVSVFMRLLQNEETSSESERSASPDIKKETTSSSYSAYDPQLSDIIARNKRVHDRVEEEKERQRKLAFERGIDFDRSIERCKRWIPDADVKIYSALHRVDAFGQITPFYWISESDYIKITDEMWNHMYGYTVGRLSDRPDGKVGEFNGGTPVYCVRE